jgi:hypothetical protein
VVVAVVAAGFFNKSTETPLLAGAAMRPYSRTSRSIFGFPERGVRTRLCSGRGDLGCADGHADCSRAIRAFEALNLVLLSNQKDAFCVVVVVQS